MSCTRRNSRPLLLLIIAFSAALNAQPSLGAADAIPWGRYLSGNQTLVSKEGNFKLGFLSPEFSLLPLYVLFEQTSSQQGLLVIQLLVLMSCTRRRNSRPLLLLIIAFSAALNAQPSLGAADAISWGRYLSGNQTLVSKEGNFELGFFSPGNSPNFYIGIWYKNIPKHTVVWVANREAPVSNKYSSELGISADGKLVLLQNKILVWSSNSTTLAAYSSVAVLLDTGNLVLRNRTNSSTIFWQSFDHPGDTWLPGAWLGMDKVTGESHIMTSSKSSDDPSPGPFTFTVDPHGSSQFLLMWNGTESYYTTGFWDGTAFSNVPPIMMTVRFVPIVVINKERRTFTESLVNNTTISRHVLEPSGQFSIYVWLDSAQDWIGAVYLPTLLCDVYSVCGVFGICDQQRTTPCSCSPGFEPVSIRAWNMNSWSEGCRRKTQLRCGNKSTNGENDDFLILENMRLPVNSHPLTLVQSAEQCKLACLNNCSCTAYAYHSGCSLWIGDIRNLQQSYNSDDKAGTFYLRLAASDIPRSSNKKKINIKVIVSAAVVVVLLIILWLAWIFPRRLHPTWKPVDGPLVLFSYNYLQRITKNFSEMIGRGGFGSVFKGVLLDSTIVAVKKLEGLRQGEKQFRAELSTLGSIQHVNLAHIRGFCCEGTKRLLVYDYMPKGSLDNYLFRNKSSPLEWRTRYQIILGIAKGLEYLHEKCRECIIHCDIKPENILIDGDFCPKVADFGMAKLLGRDFNQVLTTMRGTIGYMAPEWTSGLPITPKVDVYSYGMMLFEIISGRRNTDPFEVARFNYFPIWAAGRVIESDVLSILDVTLEGNADIEELNRVCKVACWCIQDYEIHRPSMGLIVLMLEGVLEVKIAPVPLSLERLTTYKESIISSSKSDMYCQHNDSEYFSC